MKASVRSLLKICFVIIVLLAAAGLQAADTAPPSKPAAVMPETVYEFPDTADGQYVMHDFVIRNEGNSVLNVLKVKTT